MTSNYFIDVLKEKNKYTNKYTNKYSKICYAGRLDPLAQGVMLILTDNDVKTMELNLKHNKTYTFDLILGIETSSCDIAGTIINEQNMDISNDNNDSYYQYIHKKLIEFIKNYNNQIYPHVSSYVVKHEIFGRKPLWWFAKNNININCQIPNKSVDIFDYKIYNVTSISKCEFYKTAIERLETITNTKTIDELNINSFIEVYKNKNKLQLSLDSNSKMIKIPMELSVSSGFYIRQFCNDFGKYINIPAIAFDITRTNIF
jgi:tRNA pseudouridine55 synthase